MHTVLLVRLSLRIVRAMSVCVFIHVALLNWLTREGSRVRIPCLCNRRDFGLAFFIYPKIK